MTSATPAPIVASLEALPTKPIARVVFDQGTSPGRLRRRHLRPASPLVPDGGAGRFLRRQGLHRGSLPAKGRRLRKRLRRSGRLVGSRQRGQRRVARADLANRRPRSRPPIRWSPRPADERRSPCTTTRTAGRRPGNEMFTWAQANIPAAMKAGLDYVFISYYPEDCNNYWPSQAGWQSVFDQLHRMFPDRPARLRREWQQQRPRHRGGEGRRSSIATTSCRSTATTTWAATSGGTTSRTPCPTGVTRSGRPWRPIWPDHPRHDLIRPSGTRRSGGRPAGRRRWRGGLRPGPGA